MKIFIGMAVLLAGRVFGVSNAMAHPSVGCGCSFVPRNGSIATFFFGISDHKIIVGYFGLREGSHAQP